jgi:hypothetical protein
MPLMNGSKKARYACSITNQNTAGGNKKAGLVPTATTPVAGHNAFNTHGLPRSAAFMAITTWPNVKQSRPIGVSPAVYSAYGGQKF